MTSQITDLIKTNNNTINLLFKAQKTKRNCDICNNEEKKLI